MDDQANEPHVSIVDARRRLSRATADGDSRARGEALVDLFRASFRRGAYGDAVTYAEEAWETAQANGHSDQLARLALLFADLALAAGDYQRSYDHYANACAYGAMAGEEAFVEAVARIDEVVAGLLVAGRAVRALALCDMLLAYEAVGGLGKRMPAFVAHVHDLRRQSDAQILLDRTSGQTLN